MHAVRVLVVDDETEWQDIVKELMADEEYSCFTANSYDSALAQIRQDSFNVIYLDMMLHEFDRSVREGSGWRLLNYLVEQHPRTKIVILSGRATAGDAVRLMRDYPIAAFIDKSEPDVEAQIVDAVRKATQAPALRIQSFGQFSIWRDGGLIDSWGSSQAKTLVKILLARLAARERTVSADKLIEWLWPEADPQTGRKNLLPIINSARLALEPNIEPRDSNFILRSSTGFYFELGAHVTWDMGDFWESIRQGGAKQRQGDSQGAITSFEAARHLYLDDFLIEDRYAPWAIPPRQALQSEYRDMLSSLAETYAALGRYPDAILSAESSLKVDPLLESTYRQLMRYYYAAGNKPQALKVYRNCEMLFGELFGDGLTPQTKHLFELISSDAKLDVWVPSLAEAVRKPE